MKEFYSNVVEMEDLKETKEQLLTKVIDCLNSEIMLLTSVIGMLEEIGVGELVVTGLTMVKTIKGKDYSEAVAALELVK